MGVVKMMSRHRLVGKDEYANVKRDFMFDFCINQDLFVFDRFLDIGSGVIRNSLTLDYLDKGNYHGIEISEERFNEGLKEIEELKLTHKSPDLRLGEFNSIQFDYKMDTILAFSVLIHMTDPILDECLKFVSENLSQDGNFYGNVNIGCRTNMSWAEFPCVWRSLDFYTHIANKHGLECVRMGSLRELGHHSGNELGDKQVMLKFSLKKDGTN
jgi:predicted TPR repeat methyltransferase